MKRTINRCDYVELTTRNEGKDYTQKLEGYKVTHKGGLKTRKAIEFSQSTRTNKANKMTRTRISIENKIEGISKRVEISEMTNKQRRKYFAQMNK